MRLAIDIDSTLHPYWDQLARAARRRFGVDLVYEDQINWGISLLRPEQLRACVAETHREEAVLAARPYPGAVETVRAWHEAGHFIHITSHRVTEAHDATARWLDSIGLPYDELYCSYDKVSRCEEIGIDLLIDDSPQNIATAVERGITVATITHPWNEDVVAEEGVISAKDWPTLARALEASLAPLRRTRRTGQVA